MPDAGSEPVNTTDNIPAPYMWNVSLGETERAQMLQVATGLKNNKEDFLSRGITKPP